MSDKKFKRKFVYRLGVPETNSSSSHSCCINLDAHSEAKPGDKEYDLIIKGGILFIPEPNVDFGTNTYKTNSCLVKLQYVCGLFSYGDYYGGCAQKSLHSLKTILRRTFNVKDVAFEWIEDGFLNGRLSEGEECGISIDHQSLSDMKEEICESEETIRAFILNKSSWLYIAPDGGVDIKGFYKETYTETEGDFVLSVEYGKNLGRVDIVLDDIHKVFRAECSDLRDLIIYNKTKDRYDVIDDYWASGYDSERFEGDEIYAISSYSGDDIIKEGDKYFLGLVRKDEFDDIVKARMASDPIKSTSLSGILKDYPELKVIKIPMSLRSVEFGKIF